MEDPSAHSGITVRLEKVLGVLVCEIQENVMVVGLIWVFGSHLMLSGVSEEESLMVTAGSSQTSMTFHVPLGAL